MNDLLGEAVALLVSKRLPEILRKLPEYRAGKYKARGQIMSRANVKGTVTTWARF